MIEQALQTQETGLDATQVQQVTGLVEGCSVLTLEGYTAIEELGPRDRIVTRRGLRRLKNIEATTRCFRAIRVTKGALGFYRPHRDLFLAPDQELFVRDWRAQMLYNQKSVILPASRLVDDKYIHLEATAQTHTVYDLQFEEDEVFYVDGVETVAKQAVTQNGPSPQFA